MDTAAPVTYVFIDDPTHLYLLPDTFNWEDVRHDALGFGKAHLGNVGSAYRSLNQEIKHVTGFAVGNFQYDPYFVHEENFRYYNQEIPVAKIKYSQATQEDTYLHLDFGRSFAKGISLSLAYSRINQVGEFAHQHQKNTGLGIGVWHHAPSGRYDAFYNLISNSVIAEENGGISAPELIGDTLYLDADIPTFLTAGRTNHRHRIFLTKQIIHLLPDTNSIGFDFWIKAKYQTDEYKYVDENTSLVSSYYGPYLTDDRGIRQYTYVSEHQESVGIALPWKALHSTVEGSLRYRGIKLNQEPEEKNINEVYFEATGDFHWVEPLQLNGALSLGLGQAEGNYSLEASGKLNTGIAGELSGHWHIQSREPYLFESKLFVDQILVYNEAYRNPFTSDVGVAWHVKKFDFEAGINWLLFDDYIYFNEEARPKQLTGTFSLNQFYVAKGFDFKWIGCKVKGLWQPGEKTELAIPKSMFVGTLYARINMLRKKLTLLPCIDLTWYDTYAGIGYFPVQGVYHLTGGNPIPEYLRIDVGIGTKINFLKAFIRMEDVQGLLEDRVIYQADFYPHYRGYLRVGVEAAFYN